MSTQSFAVPPERSCKRSRNRPRPNYAELDLSAPGASAYSQEYIDDSYESALDEISSSDDSDPELAQRCGHASKHELSDDERPAK